MVWRVFPCWFLLSCLCTMALCSTPSHAQDQSASKRSIEKANSGLTLFEQGKWDEALSLFREADALYHSPVFVLYAARSLQRAGRWTSARREYEKVSSETLPTAAPEAWRKAQSEARAELSALERDMPSVVVVVVGGGSATQVTLDGVLVATGQPVPLDPGRHRALATDGARRQAQTFTVGQGTRSARVELRLPAAPSKSDVEPRRRSEPRHGPYVPGLIVSGVGGAALLAGGVVGLVALHKASNAKADFPSTCDGSVCPEARRPEIEAKTDSALSLGRVSNGLFIGGALVLATGVVLLIADPGASPRVAARGWNTRIRF